MHGDELARTREWLAGSPSTWFPGLVRWIAACAWGKTNGLQQIQSLFTPRSTFSYTGKACGSCRNARPLHPHLIHPHCVAQLLCSPRFRHRRSSTRPDPASCTLYHPIACRTSPPQPHSSLPWASACHDRPEMSVSPRNPPPRLSWKKRCRLLQATPG